ncbi:Ig-like domain-containing protein [uncultured Tateyamaria sp.]|uniref:Ig-like domain-containing protein n=1 Tax=uncultured Tateyamaria sp. TaxID=455651 RepID=UPI00260F8DFE|nr:Ig-like domain-containing protein [uncultured Tateyamaria sp.]
MKAIDFVVRNDAGALQRGVVPEEGNTTVTLSSGQEISLNVRQTDLSSQNRSGDDLILTLVDGRTITLENYFNDVGEANRLFISSDGYLNEVAFVETTEGELYAQFGPTEQWGKWSPSDDLIYLGRTEVAQAATGADEEVSMLGAAILGGGSLLGLGGAAAVVGGVTLLDDGGGGTPAVPTVDDPDTTSDIGGDDVSTHVITVTGTGETGDTVEVTVGTSVVTTVIGEDGTWGVTLEGDTFPDDGTYESVVVVTHPDGETTTLDGPGVVIDTVGPEVAFTSGTDSFGHVVGGTELEGGLTLTGTGEVGATLEITIEGITRTTTVGEDGTWTATWQPGTLAEGEYSSTVTIVASDSFGNTTTVTDTVVIDTVVDVTINTSTVEIDGIINGEEASDGVTLTGTAQAGSTVVVTLAGVTHDAVVDADGNWSVDFAASEIAAGEYDAEVTAVATDAAGNTTTATGTVTVDTFVNALEITSTSGGSDGIISSAEITDGLVVTGLAEAGSTVVVTMGGATTTATVAADGSWSATFAASDIAAGTYSTEIVATATDAAGNTLSTTQTVDVDTDANVSINTDTVETDGVINGAEAADGVTLTGSADPGSSVMVTFGTVTHAATVAADGSWSVTFLASELPSGEYDATVTATATDVAGNTSTATGTVEVDTLVNALGFTSSAGGVDGTINQGEQAAGLVVTGVVEPGSSVLVQLGGATAMATVAADGSWTATFAGDQIPSGTYATDMVATATDAAGNTSSVTQSVSVDTQASILTINGPIEGDDLINAEEAADGVLLSGNADPGALVSVTMGGVTHQAVANSAGVWQAFYSANEIAPGTYQADIVATTTDAAGNTATATDTVMVDTHVDNLSVSADIIEGDNVISGAEATDGVIVTGTTEPGSTVFVTLGGVTVQAIVDANGNWQAPYTPEQVPGGEYMTEVSVTATDLAGNVATVTDTVQVDTLVNQLDIAETASDGVANAAEAREGINLGGQVEAGSTVMVDFNGTVLAAVVDASGNWSLDIPPTLIPDGTYDAEITVMATDAVGNTETISDTLSIDTEAPEGPVIASYTRDGDGVRGISTEQSDGELSVSQVNADGSITEVLGTQVEIDALGETNFAFQTDVPDGSHLIVTAEDAAGNSRGTYVVLDDESANSTIDLGNAGLGNYNIDTVDLQFAEEANLTITQAELVALSDDSNTLTIHGGSDDTVTIAGAIQTGSTTVDGQTYDIYSLGTEGVVVLDDDIVVNTAIG